MELYMITSPKVPAIVNGLFTSIKMEIASFKEMERLCMKEYKEREGKFPDWDFQENNEDYPPELAQLHNKYHQKRLKVKGLNPKDFKGYIDSFRYGAPNHAGWGVGVERLTMVMLGLNNIREAVMFPRDRDRLSP